MPCLYSFCIFLSRFSSSSWHESIVIFWIWRPMTRRASTSKSWRQRRLERAVFSRCQPLRSTICQFAKWQVNLRGNDWHWDFSQWRIFFQAEHRAAEEVRMGRCLAGGLKHFFWFYPDPWEDPMRLRLSLKWLDTSGHARLPQHSLRNFKARSPTWRNGMLS